MFFSFFFFNDTATTEIYTLSLHDALPICRLIDNFLTFSRMERDRQKFQFGTRSEEHTSELQSRPHLVCRLLLEKKKSIILLLSPNMSSRVTDVSLMSM